MAKQLCDMTEPELRELMTAMGNQIKVVASVMEVQGPLFVLLLFNDPEVGQYISNCNREDCIKALRETANRLESNLDVTRN